MANRNRLESLDSLRGLAAIAVVLFHFTVIINRYIPDFTSTTLFIQGHYGVELFFIISGFVIFMTIERSKTGLDFAVSRFSRLYPTFWACLILTFIIGSIFPLKGQEYTLWQLIINITMLQEYLKVSNIDGVYWSLTYELGFYFIIFTIFQLKQLKHIEKICLIWTITPIIFHYYSPLIPHPLHYLLLINKYSHLFAAGICFYLIKEKGFSPLRISILTGAAISQFITSDIIATTIVISFLFLFYFAMMEKLSILKYKPLVFLGVISYPLYLIHQMIGFRIIEHLHLHLKLNVEQSIFISTAVVIILATAVSHYIEKPATKKIRNISKPKRGRK